MSDEPIRPTKNRLLQATTPPNRKLFDAARRAVFLECFAATCNVRLSAARAGVAYCTVFRHRMKDAEFAAAWDEALQQGYAYLEARLLQEARFSPRSGDCPTVRPTPQSPPCPGGEEQAPSGSLCERPSVSLREPPPHPAEPDREDLGEFAEEHFDPELALTLLREHARRLPGSPDKRKRQHRQVTVATHEEIVAALTKRLKTFAVRERASQGK